MLRIAPPVLLCMNQLKGVSLAGKSQTHVAMLMTRVREIRPHLRMNFVWQSQCVHEIALTSINLSACPYVCLFSAHGCILYKFSGIVFL